MGTAATGAISINDSLMILMRSVAMGFGMGAASYISRLLGAKRDEEAGRVGSTALFTSIALLSLLAATAYIFIVPMMTLFGATSSAVRSYAVDYASWILLAAPFTAGEVVLSQILRAEGSTKYSMFGCFPAAR